MCTAGGSTCLLVRDYKGSDSRDGRFTALLPSMPAVYHVDTALLAELRATERQSAEELGQWVTKSEPSHLNVNEMTQRLNAGGRGETGRKGKRSMPGRR